MGFSFLSHICAFARQDALPNSMMAPPPHPTVYNKHAEYTTWDVEGLLCGCMGDKRSDKFLTLMI